MKWLIYHLYLKPLIIEDLRLRWLGEKSDEWFWADELASSWGYVTVFNPKPSDWKMISSDRLAEMITKGVRESRHSKQPSVHN